MQIIIILTLVFCVDILLIMNTLGLLDTYKVPQTPFNVSLFFCGVVILLGINGLIIIKAVNKFIQ